MKSPLSLLLGHSGEIWSFLLHLWYSDPSTPPKTNSGHPRRTSSYGISASSTIATEPTLHIDSSAGHTSPSMQPASPGGSASQHQQQQSHHSHHRHYGSSGSTNEKRAISPPPASPTRLDQSFHQPSITASGAGVSSGHHHHHHHHHASSSNGTTNGFSSLPGGAAAAAAALKRSAAKLKPWLPAKKFTFKYSPAEYQTAFWAFVQSEHPDTTVLRFLRARKWNVEKAMEMLILALEWRITMGVDEVVREGEEALEAKYPGFLEQLKNGKVIFRGHDRHGRPLW